MSRSHNDDRDEVHFKQGSCSVILKQGDLLNENDVDAIVIPTPALNESNPDNFALYKSIFSKANQDDKRQIEKVRSDLKLLSPAVILKKGFGYILAVPPFKGNPDKARELLRKTYTSCLSLAVKNKFRKIAFPTIGCGVIGFETRDAAREVYSALANFGQAKDGKNMDEIRIIVYNSDVWRDFTSAFTDLGCYSDAKLKFIDMYVSFCLINRASLLFALFIFLNFVSFLFHVLDHRKTQIHVKCHRKETKNKHHDNSHETTKQRSND